MSFLSRPSVLVLLVVSVAFAAPARAGSMYVESCNLGCSNGAGGAPVFGQIVDVFQDQELRIRFSLPVDLSSVDAASFRIVKTTDGSMATGRYSLDLLDPRTLVFTPALSFDSNGTPHFGFESDTAYWLFVAGVAQGDAGPFVRSSSGFDNQSRFQHTIVTSQGLQDPIRVTCSSSPNSVGAGAVLQISGSNSIAANALSMSVFGAPPAVAGVFFAGTQPRSLPLGQGLRCVGGAIQRLAPLLIDGSGAAAGPVDLGLVVPFPGEVRLFQVWYRDQSGAGTPTSNTSNGVRVLFYP